MEAKLPIGTMTPEEYEVKRLEMEDLFKTAKYALGDQSASISAIDKEPITRIREAIICWRWQFWLPCGGI
ncbi:hypothetical protein BDB01DRAFT_853863 [Pilobolus umbonatus]|nr:hypothetical protein BDB01DRAFT_853863 [Pilobolus umbonatus]